MGSAFRWASSHRHPFNNDPAVARARYRLECRTRSESRSEFVGNLKNVTSAKRSISILEPLGLDYSGSWTDHSSVSARAGDALLQRRLRHHATEWQPLHAEALARRNLTHQFRDLAEGVRTLLSADGRMSLDRTAALLQVTDRPGRIARVEQYLEAVMLRSTRQVQIEAKMIEVELRDEFSAGIDWRAVLAGQPTHASAANTLHRRRQWIHAGGQHRRFQRAAERACRSGEDQRALQSSLHGDEQ